MLALEGPAGAVVIKKVYALKALGDVTLSAGDAIKDPSWVGVLVAGLAATDDDRSKALEFTLSVTLGVAIKTLYLGLVKPNERVASVFLVIELELGVEGRPAKGVVAAITAVEVGLDPFTVELTMALATLG
jgi:hypothetical protein